MTTQETNEQTEHPPGNARINHTSLGDVLEFLGDHFELSPTTGEIASVIEFVEETHRETGGWEARALAGLSGLKLASSQVDASIREVIHALRSSEGIWIKQIERDGGRAQGWLVLIDWLRGDVEARVFEDGRQRAIHLSPLDLEGWLRIPDTREATSWIIVEPHMPLQSLSLSDTPYNSDESPAKSALRRLRLLLRSERQALIALIVYSAIVGVITLVTPVTVQAVVNTIAFTALLQPLIVLSLALLAGLLFAGALRVAEYYVVEYLQRRIFVRLIADLAHRLPRVDLDTYEKEYPPELLHRFFDVITIQKAASKLLLHSLETSLKIVIGLIVLGFYHPYLLAFDAILVAVVLFILFGLGRTAVSTSIEESSAKYDAVAWLSEIAHHPLSFKSQSGQRIAEERAEVRATQWLGTRSSHFKVVMRQVIAAVITQAVASAALLGLGGYLVLRGQITLGQLVAAELIVTTVASGLAKIGKDLETYYDLVAGVDKVGKLLDLPLERYSGEATSSNNGPYSVEMDGVCLTRGTCNLQHFTETIEPGACVALIGDDGASKSALLDAIFGWRKPEKGSVSINGIDLRRLALGTLRDDIQLVRQADVFEGTIDDNVRMGRKSIRTHEVRDALAAVDLLEEVKRLKDGLNTKLIGEGAPLSKDQLSRLMIARAILQKPKLLLIDGALDIVKPGRLDDVLNILMDPAQNWTLVIATHSDEIIERCAYAIHVGGRGAAGPPRSRVHRSRDEETKDV